MGFTEHLLQGSGFSAVSFPEGDTALVLTAAGRERLRLGRVGCRNFSGALALPSKARLHRSSDGFSASFESASTLPFGCEFLVEREITMMDRLGWFTTDVRAAERGAVGDVELESITFPGPLNVLRLRIHGRAEEKFDLAATPADTIFYSGDEPPLLAAVTGSDGVAAAFGIGFDVWRHCAAQRLAGVSALFTVRGSREGVTVTRKVLCYGEGTEPEKRPWRFCGCFGWTMPGDRLAETEEGVTSLPLAGGCFEDQKVIQELTRAVRRTQGRVVAAAGTPALCTDPGHLDRAGKGPLEHLDLEERMRCFRRANRELAKRGGAFAFRQPENGGDPLTLALARFPEPLAEIEDEA